MKRGDIIGGCLEVVATPANMLQWAACELLARIEWSEVDDAEESEQDTVTE